MSVTFATFYPAESSWGAAALKSASVKPSRLAQDFSILNSFHQADPFQQERSDGCFIGVGVLVAEAIFDHADRELGLLDPSQNTFLGTQARTCLNSASNFASKGVVFHECSIADRFPPSNGELPLDALNDLFVRF